MEVYAHCLAGRALTELCQAAALGTQTHPNQGHPSHLMPTQSMWGGGCLHTLTLASPHAHTQHRRLTPSPPHTHNHTLITNALDALGVNRVPIRHAGPFGALSSYFVHLCANMIDYHRTMLCTSQYYCPWSVDAHILVTAKPYRELYPWRHADTVSREPEYLNSASTLPVDSTLS